MRNRILFLTLAFFCVRAEAQDIVGTPLNVPYATLLDWLITPAPNKEVMPDWIKNELVRHARPEHREFARSVKVTLLGTTPESPCDSMKSFALSRSSSDGGPEIVFCARTVQYLEQVIRALQLLFVNGTFKEAHQTRRTQLLDSYIGYLNRQLGADRDVADDPGKFAQFCSVEFYILVNVLGFFGNDCPREAIAKHSADFNRFFWGGGFNPALSGIPPEERQEAVRNYTQSTLTSEWRGIWRSAALHEFGHLVSCHQGIFLGLRCGKPGSRREALSLSSLHDEPLEIQADGYVLSRVVAANPDDLVKIVATTTALMMYSFSSAIWSQGDDLRLDRLSANQETYKRIYRKVFSNKEIVEILRKVDAQVLSEIEASLK